MNQKMAKKSQRVEIENLKIAKALSSKTDKPNANSSYLQDTSSQLESENSDEEFSPCSSMVYMPLTKLYRYNFQEKYGKPNPKGEFPQYPFLLFREKVYAFSSTFLYVHIRTNQTVTYRTKVFQKKIFCKGVQLYFEILILLFIQKIFEHTRNFYLYVTVHLVRIWTYKNADEKAHTFSKRNKHKKKKDNV